MSSEYEDNDSQPQQPQLEQSSQQQQQPQQPKENSNAVIRKKITTVINRVKLEREKEKLKEEHLRSDSKKSVTSLSEKNGRPMSGGEARRKLNIANIRSSGRVLYVPTSIPGSGQQEGNLLNTSNTVSQNSALTSSSLKDTNTTSQNRNKNENNLVNSSSANRVTFNEQLNTPSTQRRTPITAPPPPRSSNKKKMAQLQNPMPYANIDESDLSVVQVVRRKVYMFVMSPWFELAVTVFILLNTVCLAIEHHDMDQDIETILSICNHVSINSFLLFLLILVLILSLNKKRNYNFRMI